MVQLKSDKHLSTEKQIQKDSVTGPATAFKRRSFLFGAMATGATALAATSVYAGKSDDADETKPSAKASKLYNADSKHVRRYYQAARF